MEDHDVVEVEDHRSLGLLAKRVAHRGWERSRSVANNERHDLVLEVAVTATESSLPFFPFDDLYEVVGSTELEPRKLTQFDQPVKSLKNQVQWVETLDDHRVDAMKVHVKPEQPVSLLDKQDGIISGGGDGLDESCLK